MNSMYARRQVDVTKPQEKLMPTQKPEKNAVKNPIGQISYEALVKVIATLAEAHINVISLSTGMKIEEALEKLEKHRDETSSSSQD